tara:strand:+ start:1313 stop:1534 length:222 start_codon:yes stop_codon:yes gene_type:complete
MCDRPIKNARTKNKNRIMKKWIKENIWLVFMLVGISLMTWAIASGESFIGHIPLACGILIAGVLIDTSNGKRL